MTLANVTSARAVTKALEEAAALGRAPFLAKYGFGPARHYFVLHKGRHFDSKAILGAAHGFQHGTPLKPADFSGGDATVAAKLQQLGFHVTRENDWQLDEGDITRRSDVKDLYGGTIYGGIEPSRTSPNIIIYTDPTEGAKHGYTYDKWDDIEPDLFHYTGEGTDGDQQFTDGNRAILNHAQTGRTLRLFHTIDQAKRPGGKRQEYLGAFYLDPTIPWRYEPGLDRHGRPRKVIVFHLRKDLAAPTPGNSQRTPILAAPTTAPKLPPTTPGKKLRLVVTHVPSEQNTALEYEIAAQEPKVARRVEAELVADFEAWLRGRGHVTERIRIEAPGLEYALVTDTYDKTENVLYEAKASADRTSIRLAVGQLLDYLRFTGDMRGRILLPEPPLIDLEDLINAAGYGLAYRTDEGSWEVFD